MEEFAYVLFYLFVGQFIIIAMLEKLFPRRELTVSLVRRWCVNGLLEIFNTAILRVLIPVTAVVFAVQIDAYGWGLFQLVPVPFWANVLCSFVILDIARYWIHRAFHEVPLLWRIHQVHHADRDYDLTTGLRFHPLEGVITAFLYLSLIALFGMSHLAVVIQEVVVIFFVFFAHGNIGIATRVDQYLRLVIVTPDMHRVHHSVEIAETNSNYGTHFTVWDRIFNSYTAQPRLGHTGMSIGLTDVGWKSSLNILTLLTMPFKARVRTDP